MNTRILSFVASATVMVLSTGCCANLKQFWFGRGARCGSCPSTYNPLYTQPPVVSAPSMQAPVAPYGPSVAAPTPQYTPAPQYAPQSLVPIAPQPRCGLFNRILPNRTAVSPAPTGQVYGHAMADCCPPCGDPCASCYSGFHDECGAYYSNRSGCECGNCGSETYDPYLSGNVIHEGIVPYDGQIIGSEVIGGQVYGGQSYQGSTMYGGSTTMQDDFDARGDRIMSADPLPPGAQLMP